MSTPRKAAQSSRYASFMPEKSSLAFNKNSFGAIIESKMNSTFNQDSLILFENMLAVVNYLENQNDKTDFIFGTDNFHHVWERLVDFVYGEKDKERFYPKVYWKLNGRNSAFEFNSDVRKNFLRPDTIMIANRGKEKQKIFVLDSKYYRYGATHNPNHLPDSSSIVKQIAYAEFIERQFEKSSGGAAVRLPSDVTNVKSFDSARHIFNAFVFPADCAEIRSIGFASADYVLSRNKERPKKEYHRIFGVLLDVRTLMEQHCRHNVKEIAKLAEFISNLS